MGWSIPGRAADRERRPVLRTFAGLYTLGAAVWFALDHTPVADWWLFQVIDLVNLWFYLPLPLLLLSMGLRRHWEKGPWLLVPLLTFVAEYGPFLSPHVVREQGIPLRVMSANLQFINEDDLSVGNAMLGQSPDVIAIQELGAGIADALAERVREQYPYQALYPSRSALGMGIFSRYPLRDSVPPDMTPKGCKCQQVSIQVEGRQVTILNVHPFPPAWNYLQWGPIVLPTGFSTSSQEVALQAIRDRAGAVGQPLLILGDLNVTDRQGAYRILGDLYRDAYREAGRGFGFTFPTQGAYDLPFFPLVRLDYVLHDDAWTAHDAWTEDLPGSDHQAVVADLVLRGG